jgi:coupling of ubiquitin conjugation to ER degradation protein 1
VAAPAAGSSSSAPTAALKHTGPDLIQRYNLAGRIVESSDAAPEAVKVAWSSSKTERQTSLQKRREEMILAARRKMLEKD